MGRLPDFIVIGAQRAGTTSLYDYLTRHPRIAGASRKELHYFSLFYTRGERWYRRQFPGHRFSSSITGEATPYYLFHPAAPSRVEHVCPNTRFIVLLRNPIERAFSHYRHSRNRGWESLSFSEALDAEPRRLAGVEERLLADPGYRSFSHQHHSYLARGAYADQLDVWMQRFPTERFHIAESGAFFADPARTLAGMFDFLEVGDADVGPFEPLNTSSDDAELDADVRLRLREHFAPLNEKLYVALGVDHGWT